MNKFIFDVDGTLTPSRGKMDEKFSQFFFDFCTLHDVYLVTGSDRPKTVEQIGNVIYGMAKRVYNCCLLYTSPSPRDRQKSRMPSSA